MRCWRTDHNIARLINQARQEAHAKHGDNSIESIPAGDGRWLPILVEEVGEVAHALTYDVDQDTAKQQLADELMDVLAVASAWLDALADDGVEPAVSRRVWTA